MYIFIEHTVMFVAYLLAAKGFTSNVSIVVVGHWSKDKSLQFNFTSDAEHSNAITYFMAKQSTHCAHPIQQSSIWVPKTTCQPPLFSWTNCG